MHFHVVEYIKDAVCRVGRKIYE